ncbi:MAG: anion permease [Elusimicrobia bacterium CG06_land_8_20_14_3_00_38_11]|nr:MAG: anion permease [Elusimicrobia bacterium CG06_land_8_20_14_3_00_38_11]
MDTTLIIGILIVVLALVFDFSNGFNDSANIVATVIGTRALTPAKAIFFASIFEFIGAYFLGTAVAKTIGKGIIDPMIITGDKYGIVIIFATVLSAAGWNVICSIFGFPVSASHALVGGLVGAGMVAGGLDIVQWKNVLTIIVVLILAPVMGFVGSFIVTKIVYFLARGATPRVNKLFKFLQICSSMTFALSHGTNDAQKTMGIITFALIVLGLYKPTGDVFIPNWVIIACALSITLGIVLGGKAVISTVGMDIYKIKPINGFSAEGAGAGVIYLATALGLPVSTTHIISGAVMGTGAAERIKAVRWGQSANIFIVWLITIPSTIIVSAVIYYLLLNGIKFLGW